MDLNKSLKKGKKYINSEPTSEPGFREFLSITKEYLYHSSNNTPKKPLGPFHTDAGLYRHPPQNGLRVTWLGHATLLIEIDGCRFLTDPVWSKRVSFSQFFGPKRFFQPPLALRNLPPLDAIIISHDHYDHLDKATIKHFAGTDIPFLCSVGVGQYLKRWGIAPGRITEMDWGNSVVIGQNCKITATPARHFSGRGITHRNETLWSSFVIKGNRHNIYFGADSGWFEGYHDIGNAFGPFDLTMLGIGAYGKYWPDIHTTPADALRANKALNGKLMLPFHWGTFPLAPHAWYEPVEELVTLAQQQHQDILVPTPGQPEDITGNKISEWWKPYK